jgi:hypothetical protein
LDYLGLSVHRSHYCLFMVRHRKVRQALLSHPWNFPWIIWDYLSIEVITVYSWLDREKFDRLFYHTLGTFLGLFGTIWDYLSIEVITVYSWLDREKLDRFFYHTLGTFLGLFGTICPRSQILQFIL